MNKETKTKKITLEDVLNRHACEVYSLDKIIALHNKKIDELEKVTKLNKLTCEMLTQYTENEFLFAQSRTNALKDEISWYFWSTLGLHFVAIILLICAIIHW
jgi:TolA-binding protein